MNFEDFGLFQHQLFSRSPPRDLADFSIRQGALSLIQNQVDLQGGSTVLYDIKDSDRATRGCDSLTDSILDSIQTNDTGLTLYKTTGQYPSGFCSYNEKTVYRLTREQNHAHIDFDFVNDGRICHVLIFFVQPSFQGRLHNVRDFLIKRFARTMFDLEGHKVSMIAGRAVANQFPVRQREWRDKRTSDGKTTRLVRLYEKLGMRQDASQPEFVYLFPEQTQK